MSNPHRIYFTRVMHRRLFPAPYRFEYPVFSLLLDIDAVDDPARHADLPRHLSIGPARGWLPGLFRFDPKDHGPHDGTPLRPWVEALLRTHDIDLAGGRIRLLAFPRVLGYGFNPLSVWYCEHRDGSLRAVLGEVSNTFGEHHVYLLAEGGAPITWPLRGQAEKCFYVSPLIEVYGGYHFRFSEPTEQIAVLIRQFDDAGRLLLVATQTGRGEPLTDAALWRAFWRTPLMTFKVMVAIHWHALKIWLSGVPYVPKPKPPDQGTTAGSTSTAP